MTTPQPLAQEVASRAATMAQKTNMRLIGVVENMTSDVFGTGGGERLAARDRRAAARQGPARPAAARVRRRGRAARLGGARLGDLTRDRPDRRGDPRRPADVQGAAGPELSTPLERLRALGFSEADAATLADHFLDAERRGKTSHGLARIDWLETLPDVDPSRGRSGVVAEPGYERWDGAGALGYLTLAAICDAVLADPPANARVVVAARCFPTGSLGYWVRRLAEGGLAAALTATSPRRLASPDGGPPLAGTNPIAIGVPSSDGEPLVADVSMGRVTHGDVLAGLAPPEELVPFGGDRALQGVRAGGRPRDARRGARGRGARRAAARRRARSTTRCPALRALAGGVRLPGDR